MIEGYVGANGAGKSVLAVDAVCRRAEKRGCPVWSTVPINWPGVEVRPIASLADFMGAEGGEVLLDEVASLFSSRETSSLPSDVVARLTSLRHFDLVVTWTAPSWKRCDVVLREVTQKVWQVTPTWTRPTGGVWRRTVLARARAYDTRSLSGEDFGKDERVRGTLRFFRPKSLRSFGTFDSTWRVVPLVRNECGECGLLKRREFCKCKNS